MAKRHLIHDVTYNARICDLTDYNANICMLHLFQTLVHSSRQMFFFSCFRNLETRNKMEAFRYLDIFYI